jgi:hypothetical protein
MRDSLQRGVRVQLLDHGTHVASDRCISHAKANADVAIAGSSHKEFEDLALTPSQTTQEQRPLLPCDLLAASAVRKGENVRDGLQELNVIGCELATHLRICTEDPERHAVAPDEHAHATHDAVISQERRWTKAFLGPKVGDDHRLVVLKRVASMRLKTGSERGTPDQPLPPANPCAQQQRGAARKQLKHPRSFDLKGICDARRSRLE